MKSVGLAVRLLHLADVEAYLQHVANVDAGSGVDGEPHSHPYSRDETFVVDEARAQRETVRWTTPLDQTGWRRAWGLIDAGDLVGHLYLAGSMLTSGLHRVELGIGVTRRHRRRGGGSRLLSTAIEWARAQPGIDWIDLGVFGDNPRARALYERHGFVEIGSTPDRFRVDGVSLDDVTMTLNVAAAR